MTQSETQNAISHFLSKSQEHARRSADYAKAAELLNNKLTETDSLASTKYERNMKQPRQ